MLGFRQKTQIKIFTGEVFGYINNNHLISNAFAFDDIFYIDGISLHELKQKTNHHEYNARFLAMSKLMKNKDCLTIRIKDIKKWTGDYQ